MNSSDGLIDFKQSSLVVMPTNSIRNLDFKNWGACYSHITSCVHCDAPDGNSKQIFLDCNEIFQQGKKAAVITSSQFATHGAIRAAAQNFAKMGLLLLDRDPVSNVPKFIQNIKVSAISFEMPTTTYYDNAEIFTPKYIKWMEEAGNGWETISYDIVAGLPRFTWVSINAACLKKFNTQNLMKIFKTLADNKVIYGFDVYNWNAISVFQSMELLRSLGFYLLLSQGKIAVNSDEIERLEKISQENF